MKRALCRIPSSLAILCLAAASLLAAPRQVWAAPTLTVTTVQDELNAVGQTGTGCSLREAIYTLNYGASRGGCSFSSGITSIYVPAGTYTLSIFGYGEDAGATGDLDILNSMQISGDGPAATRILTATGLRDRIFDINPKARQAYLSVTLENLAISGALIPATPLDPYGGGGILNTHASLLVKNVLISGNTAGVPDGIVATGGGVNNMPGSSLTIINSTISGNTGGFGGGVYNESGGTLAVYASTLTGNTALTSGGGLENRGQTIVDGSTISANNVVNETKNGTGIKNSYAMKVTNSTIAANQGTGLDTSGGSLEMHNTIISANQGVGLIAGLNLTISYSHIVDNVGVGVQISAGTAVITYTTISGNAPASPAQGAGILNSGALVLRSSTVANNSSTGLKISGGSAALTNTTISGNFSSIDPVGGVGIDNSAVATLSLLDSTIADNAGVGLQLSAGSTTLVQNTILARHAAANCSIAGASFTSGGHNLLDNTSPAGATPCPFSGTGDQTAIPAASLGLAGSLADNGGFTQTYALELGSPAMDQIPAGDPSCLPVDQRGYGRPAGAGCDVGAFEYDGAHFEKYLPLFMN